MTKPLEICDTCKYSVPKTNWNAATPVTAFLCKFMPPVLDQSYGTSWVRPMMESGDWCGQWKPSVTEEMLEETSEWTEG